MSSGRDATTLTVPRRCAYCGRRPCECGADLRRIEAAMRGDTHPAKTKFRATCPNPKCGELAKPGRKYCAFCRTPLYATEAFLSALTTKGAGG